MVKMPRHMFLYQLATIKQEMLTKGNIDEFGEFESNTKLKPLKCIHNNNNLFCQNHHTHDFPKFNDVKVGTL